MYPSACAEAVQDRAALLVVAAPAVRPVGAASCAGAGVVAVVCAGAEGRCVPDSSMATTWMVYAVCEVRPSRSVGGAATANVWACPGSAVGQTVTVYPVAPVTGFQVRLMLVSLVAVAPRPVGVGSWTRPSAGQVSGSMPVTSVS